MKLKFVFLAVFSLILVNCGKSGDPHATSSLSSPLELYQQDRQNVADLPQAQTSDREAQEAFRKIFGGATRQDVLAYVDRRVSQFWNYSDVNTIEIKPSVLGRGSLFAFEGIPSQVVDQKIRIAALNMGMTLWWASRVDHERVWVRQGSQEMEITSARKGFVLLGEAYAPTSHFSDYGSVAVPADYRFTIIVHEARHSDCTGGFTQAMIAKSKKANSFNDFLSLLGKPQMTCGHAHVECPMGHDYSGVHACDKETWGAYGVGAIYAAATENTYAEDTVERRLMEITKLDSFSRIPGVTMSSYRKSKPDMSSQDE